jgi:elongator complex protein 1
MTAEGMAAVCFAAQGLLRELLDRLPADDVRRRDVLEAYGTVLAARNLTEDAAVAFVAAGKLDLALAQYKLAGQWAMAFVLAGAEHQLLLLCPCI